MTTTDTHGRYTEAAMTEAMRHIADRLDVPSHDARLLRLTNNAVFALPTAAIVVRTTRSTTLHDRVHRTATTSPKTLTGPPREKHVNSRWCAPPHHYSLAHRA